MSEIEAVPTVMGRGEWLLHLARVLCSEPGHVATIAIEAQRKGMVSVGARGVNSVPFTEAEMRTIVECCVISTCLGSVVWSTAAKRYQICSVEWGHDGLTVRRDAGIKVTAHLSQSLVTRALQVGPAPNRELSSE